MHRWDLLRDIFLLRDRIDKVFGHATSEAWDPESHTWVPAIDVCETQDAFLVKAELPDVNESDITISLEHNILTIKGERRQEREGKNYYRVERMYGPFSRSFVLPAHVNKESISASLRDGILSIILPKETQERHIEIT